MGFSSVAELIRNIPSISGVISTSSLTANIADGDNTIYDDLSKIVDWNDIEGLTYVPRLINRLSQYKAAELTIVRKWQDDDTVIGDGAEAQNNAHTYWEEQYDKLLNKIKGGDVLILDNNNDEISEEYARRPGIGRII
jgi:hypothetical protein